MRSPLLSLAVVVVALTAAALLPGCDDQLEQLPGRVVGEVCDPVSGAPLTIPVRLDVDGDVVASDASGHYEFANARAGADVVVAGAGAAARRFDVVVVAGDVVNVEDPACRAPPAGFGAIEGAVCGLDHRALVDALVTVVVADAEVVSGRTDGAGEFRVDHVPVGDVILAVRAAGAGFDFALSVRAGETTTLPASLTCDDPLIEAPERTDEAHEADEADEADEGAGPTPPPLPETPAPTPQEPPPAPTPPPTPAPTPPTCTPHTETCENGVDEDCDGIDNACDPITVQLSIDGDCVTARCPAAAPHPVGCDIRLQGGDNRGCVANDYGSSVVYFQEGDACHAGHVSGQLFCSSFLPPDPLNAQNCPINKQRQFHVEDRDDCPETNN